jgi:hypothetical protein
MSISQNFPDEGPTLNLNFAGSRTLDPRITFTRTSSGTYLGDNGLIKIAATNSPRFDHSYNSATGEIESLGLLIEEARTNLLLHSEAFEQSIWSKGGVSVTTNTISSPNGLLVADKLVEDITDSNHFTIQIATLSNGTTFTTSVYLKPEERTIARVRLGDSGFIYGAVVNLVNGNIISTDGIGSSKTTFLGNGWVRVDCTGTVVNGNIASLGVYLRQDSSTESYSGNGTSGIYIWGAQLEEGAFPTSYIPTTASTVTRTVDSVSMTGTNFSSWYNPNEGSLYCSGMSNVTSDSTLNPRAAIATLFQSSQTGFSLSIKKDSSQIESFARVAGISFNDSTLSYILGSSFKSLMAYSRTNLDIALNGFTNIGNPNPTSLQSNPIQLFLGNQVLAGTNTSNTYLNGHISQLSYYPKRLSNAQLQTLTR